MPTLYILTGLPGSGKSTWAKTKMPQAMRICLDDLRLMLYNEPFNAAHERKIRVASEALLDAIIPDAAMHGYDVIFDATNVTPKHRKPLVELAHRHGLRAIAVSILCPIQTAMNRNSARPNPVPEDAIIRFVKNLVYPSYEEGFDDIWEYNT